MFFIEVITVISTLTDFLIYFILCVCLRACVCMCALCLQKPEEGAE